MSGGTMGRAISAIIAALVFCGACLSQQDQKTSQQPAANAPRTAPELQSPTKFSDGVLAFDVGKVPIGVVCDGTNIWVANAESDNVMKLRASDGGVVRTFKVGR